MTTFPKLIRGKRDVECKHPQVVEVAEVDAVDAVGRLGIVADAFLAEHKIIDRPQHRLVLDEV